MLIANSIIRASTVLHAVLRDDMSHTHVHMYRLTERLVEVTKHRYVRVYILTSFISLYPLPINGTRYTLQLLRCKLLLERCQNCFTCITVAFRPILHVVPLPSQTSVIGFTDAT